MRKGPTEAQALQILRICHMLCNLDMSHSAIADELDISVQAVARRVSQAKSWKWIQTQRILNFPPEFQYLRELVSKPDLEHNLKQKLEADYARVQERRQRSEPCALVHVTVVPSDKQVDKTRERVGQAMAWLMEAHLASGEHNVGVNWSETVDSCARALVSVNNDDVRFFAVFGDMALPLKHPAYESKSWYSSNRIASLMAESFGATRHPPVHLSFQGFIPREFGPEQFRTIRQWVKSDASYQKVFADHGGLIHRADTLLTGVGALEKRSAWLRFSGLVEDDEEDRKEIDRELSSMEARGIVGDIAGWYVGPRGFAAPMPKHNVKARVLGLRPSHLRRIARDRVTHKTGLGVVVGTLWYPEAEHPRAERVRIIVAAVRGGAASHLVIDERLAELIIKHLESEEANA